jgi:hypothetical protein
VVDSGLSSSVRKKTGLHQHGTDTVGGDFRLQRFYPALDAKLGRRIGAQEQAARQACRGGHREHKSSPLLAHHRQHGARDVHRAKQQGVDLLAHLPAAEFLEEAGVEVAGVVDQHVEAPEPCDRCGRRRLGVFEAGDIERETQQALMVAESRRDLPRVPAGRHHGVTGRQRGFGDLDSQAPAGTGDEPDLWVVHDLSEGAGEEGRESGQRRPAEPGLAAAEGGGRV